MTTDAPTREVGALAPLEHTADPMPALDARGPYLRRGRLLDGIPAAEMHRSPAHVTFTLLLDDHEHAVREWCIRGCRNDATVLSLLVRAADLRIIEHPGRKADPDDPTDLDGPPLREILLRGLDGTWRQALTPADHSLVGDGMPRLARPGSEPAEDLYWVHLFLSEITIGGRE